MKTLAFVAALMIGGAAIAQTTPDSTMPDSTMTTPDATTPPSDGTMTTPTSQMPDQTMPMGTTMAPVPTTAPMAPTGDYPRCSRTITDHCKQDMSRESDWKGGPPAHRRMRRH